MSEPTTTLRLFVDRDPKAGYILFTPDQLEDSGLTEADVLAARPSGQWHTIEVVTDFLRRHETEIETKIQELDPKTRQLKRNAARYEGALISTVVRSWTVSPEPPSEESFSRLPAVLADAVSAIVLLHCRKGGWGDPDFLSQQKNNAAESSPGSA